jgi:hypothetical protein
VAHLAQVVYIFQIPSPIRAFQRGLSVNQPLIIFQAIDLTKVGSSSTQDADINLIKNEEMNQLLPSKKKGKNIMENSTKRWRMQ